MGKAQRGSSSSRLYWLALVLTGVIMIGVLIILLGERQREASENQWKNSTNPSDNATNTVVKRTKRSTGRPATVYTANFTECRQSGSLQAVSLTLCIPENSSTTTVIPFTSLTNNRGQNGGGWGDRHQWYVTIGDTWDDLVGDTGMNWRRWSKGAAIAIAKTISLKMSPTGFTFKINITAATSTGSVRDPNTPCARFYFWAYSNQQDPKFPVFVCISSRIPRPSSDAVTREKGVIIHKTSDWTVDLEFQAATGISGTSLTSNNWLLMAQQAALSTATDCLVCMAARPLLLLVPAPVKPECVKKLMMADNPGTNCSQYDRAFPITSPELKKPLFSSHIPQMNYTCLNGTGGIPLPGFSKTLCAIVIFTKASDHGVPRADIWYHCGANKLYDRIPKNSSGLCALVTLLLPVNTFQMTIADLAKVTAVYPFSGIAKRSTSDSNPTYIDAIGVPRGVPSEFKLADQVADGWASIVCPWCIMNKNVDRINFIHYNVQRLGNLTHDGLKAVSEQLKATSLMAYQNRMALDMLLAEKGGVCFMFGDQCCTFIPNNTAADGSLQAALHGLKTLNNKMKEMSGIDESRWDRWMSVFGNYKGLVTSTLVSIAVFAAVLTLCGCCCIPCLRSLVERLIGAATSKRHPHQLNKWP
nr:uncharacterized protein LOC117451701 [Pseudochaenichthys georgianus]